MKKVFTTLLLFALTGMGLMAQAPSGYYNDATGKTGDELKIALHDIIKDHTTISYQQIWSAFWSTDNKGNNVVWDMYSDGADYTYNYYSNGNNQCGEYEQEGDCYNREHSWPQSWFNNAETPTKDLHHIFPTDGFVNYQRSNYPFGEVQTATWTSQNGSKLGNCKSSLGYSSKVFEPIDEYKGDFARALMYMSVRYYDEDSDWGTSGMTDKSVIKPWAIAMLLNWSDNDPVSQKEIDRNNVVYGIQGNRNPFIDHPEYAHIIWEEGWTGVTYNITCASVQHGTIAAPATAVEGTMVTLTATPAPGYMLGSWNVYKTGDTNTTVAVSSNGTFTMPSFNVTVSATFIQNSTLYNVTCATGLSHGTISANPSSAMSGTTITLGNSPSNGYSLYSYYVYKTGDINTIVYSGSSNTFTMPAFDVTVSASFVQGSGGNYVKVTSAPSDWSGTYLIVYETGARAFNGGLTTLDASNNYISVTITNNTIASTNQTEAAKFIVDKAGNNYTIKSASGFYIGQTSDANGLSSSRSQAYTNTISYNANESSINIVGSGGAYLRYNANSGQNRFRYFKSSTYSSQKAIQLYKKANNSASAPTHTIQYNPNGGSQSSYTQSVNEFEPTALLANAFTRNGFAFDSWNTAADGSGTSYFDGAIVTLLNDLTLYAQWMPTYTVTCASVEHGSISTDLTEAVEGALVTLTATPDDNYELDAWIVAVNNEPIEVEDNQFVMPAGNVTVSANFVYLGQPFEQKYYLITSTDQLVAGRTYLIVNTSAKKAMSTTQNNNNRSAVDVTVSNGCISSIGSTVCEFTLGGSTDAWTFFDPQWNNTGGYLFAASSSNNNLKTQATNDANGQWSIAFASNGTATIVAQGTNSRNQLRYNPNGGSPIFSCYGNTSNLAKVELYVRSEEYEYTESALITCLNSFDKHTIHSGVTLTANSVMGISQCNKAEQIILEDGAQLVHTATGLNATMKKAVTAYSGGGGWYAISVPFGSFNPASTTMVSNNCDLYAYDEFGDTESKEWINYKAGAFNLTSGQGYLYAHNPSTTLRMAGTLNSGNYTQTVDLGYANGCASIQGFNLIGNPTAHEITFSKTANVSDGYYYLNNNENWVYSASNVVPVGRGFLVKANAANQSVTLNPQTKRGESLEEGQYLFVSVGKSEAYVKLNEGISMPLMGLGEKRSNLYLLSESKPYIMLVRGEADAIDLCFEPRSNGKQTLVVDAAGLDLDYLHLIDLKTDADIDLLATPSYVFEAKKGDYATRFRLVFAH